MTLADHAGSIALGGHTVPRLGFGTMRLTGPRIFGEPADPKACVRTVRDAYEGGVRVFDTAWYYGPDVASRIVREPWRHTRTTSCSSASSAAPGGRTGTGTPRPPATSCARGPNDNAACSGSTTCPWCISVGWRPAAGCPSRRC